MSEDRAPLSLSRWDLLAAGALVFLGAAWAVLGDRLPARVPTHFDLAGHPNGWTDRSVMPWIVLGLPTGVWLLMWLLDLGAAALDKAEATKMATLRPLRGLMAVGFVGLGLSMLLIPLRGLWILWPALGFLLLCLGVGLWQAVLLARRYAPVADEDCWRWGLFYVNPRDERIWLPKRVGLGWTLNFGRPAAWLVLLLILALPLPLLLLLAR